MFIMEFLPPDNMSAPLPGDVPGEQAGRLAWSRSNLTLGQWQIWYEQRSGASAKPHYTRSPLSAAFSFHASLDTRLFRQAFQSVVERSDTLRTVFVEEDGVPQRYVLPSIAMAMDIVDLSASYQPVAAYEQWMAERDLRPFSPARRLFDSTLLRLSDQHYVWRLVLHRLIADSRTLALVYRYTAEAYAAAAVGSIDALGALASFEDYARYERRQALAPAVPESRGSLRPQGRPAKPLPVSGERYVLDLGAERTALLRRMGAAAPAGTPDDTGSAIFLPAATALAALITRRRRCRRVYLDTDLDLRHLGPWQDTPGRISRAHTLMVEDVQQLSLAGLAGRLGRELAKAQRGDPVALNGAQNGAQGADRPVPACSALLQVDDVVFPPFAGAEVKVERLDTCYSLRKSGEPYEARVEPSICLRIEGYSGPENLKAVFTFGSGHLGETRGPQLAQEYMRLLDALLSAREQPISSLCLGH